LNEFLERNFSDAKHEAVRNSVLRFAEGFDLADPSEASVLALREEWMGEEDEQYRIPGGFDQLTDYLEKKCTQLGCIIHRSTRAHKIVWSKDEVTITSDKGIYYGNQVVITVPLPLLQQQQIIFEPAIPDHIDAAKRIGFGTVVKVVLEFKESFWREKKKNIGFILSNEIIPTWWTQSPSSYPLLTGWAGGPQAWPMKDSNDEVILDLALYSLSNIFNRPVADLQKIMNTFLIANWHTEPFTMGAYSYSLVGSTPAQLLFNDPIADTIFFAGEAFYNGCSPGTVEAALESAKNVVETMAERGEQ